jgi:hypothetical protein
VDSSLTTGEVSHMAAAKKKAAKKAAKPAKKAAKGKRK